MRLNIYLTSLTTRSWLLAWRSCGMALAWCFIGLFCWHTLGSGGHPMLNISASVCITVPGMQQGNFQCAFTCAHSFYSASCSGGVLSHFRVFFSTELLVQCDRCVGLSWVWQKGLVTGLQVGQAWGCSCHLGLGLAAQAPRFLGTQCPCATQTLTTGYVRRQQYIPVDMKYLLVKKNRYPVSTSISDGSTLITAGSYLITSITSFAVPPICLNFSLTGLT